jgi:hypothetical protein
MKRKNKKHLNPLELKELTDADFFSGDYSEDMWNEINILNKEGPKEEPLTVLTWKALYKMGCRLQEFESFVRRRLKELEAKLNLGISDEEIKVLNKRKP